MNRLLLTVSLVLLALLVGAGAGAGLFYKFTRPAPLPASPAIIQQMREVARLETLEVSLYKKVSFQPEPQPASSLWGELISWAAYSLRAPEGRAIVFARGHIGMDLEKLGPDRLRIVGRTAFVVLPPQRVQVELLPGETEIIGSNLDSQETALLFEKARAAFENEVQADRRLREKARASAERALRGLLFSLGFSEVRFVEQLPMLEAS